MDVTTDPSLQFKVHYHGWNAAWDEWVTQSRLLPFNNENEEKKKTLDLLFKENMNRQKKRKIEDATSTRRKKKSQRTKGKQSAVSKSGQKTGDIQSGEEDSSVTKMNLKIPFNLQKQLVADWERIHKHELMSLPCSPCVMDILEKWAAKERRKKHTPTAQNTIKIVTKGLIDFFDSALSKCLLYAFERQQYDEESKRSKRKKKPLKASQTYGAEHFLRLFVKLPDLFVDMNVSDEDQQFFHQQLADILKFLSKQSGTMFSKKYEQASETYVKAFKRTEEENILL